MAATVSNPVATNEALESLSSSQRSASEDIQELEATRDRLETAPEPDHVLDTDAKYEPDDEQPGFEMTQPRRVGSFALPVDGHGNLRFGKPSGRTSGEMIEPIEEMERGARKLSDLQAYIWHTLAEWSLDDEYDADFWADELGMIDAVDLTRSVALGGNTHAR